jgi:hypothetical protein
VLFFLVGFAVGMVLVLVERVLRDRDFARRERLFDVERAEWTAERRELLNRIQRPEYAPMPVHEWTYQPDDDGPDEINLVGTIAELKTDDG